MQEKREKIDSFLNKSKNEESKDQKKTDEDGQTSKEPVKMDLADVIIAAAAAKTVKLKSKGLIEIIYLFLIHPYSFR